MTTVVEIIVVGGILMLVFILLIILIAFKPWRFFPSSFSSSRFRVVKAGELDRPLVSDDGDLVRNQGNELPRDYDLEGACFQGEGHLRSQGLVYKQRLPNTASNATQSDTLVVDVISDASEDILIGQTLKRPLLTQQLVEDQRTSRQNLGQDRVQQFVPKEPLDQRTCLNLEVLSGPSRGLRCSIQSANSSRLPLTLGRVPPSDLLLKDSEVSGKHAMINWNLNKMKWELVDMGSLNGTLLNSQPINTVGTGSRQWGDPVVLASGDVITLGTTSKVFVHISFQTESQVPFGVGMASDPMAMRRGGKKLPMEDVCYYQWPLNGIDKFGIFGICDGHGGAEAAKYASKLLPETVANLLSDSLNREKVLLQCDASYVLRDAFYQTETTLNYHYEGCTATVLLVWTDGDDNYFAQCANLGDSACIMNVDGKLVKMSEDHRISSYTERLRIQETGVPLKDGETRLCGLNLARMLGDKFLKQQDSRFSSVPYISQVIKIDQASNAFALMASDGFWDVISAKKAVQLVQQTREKHPTDGENIAEKTANMLLSEARTGRTKDNTSIIFLEFDSSRIACKGGS